MVRRLLRSLPSRAPSSPASSSCSGVDANGSQLYLNEGSCIPSAACPAGTFADQGASSLSFPRALTLSDRPSQVDSRPFAPSRRRQNLRLLRRSLRRGYGDVHGRRGDVLHERRAPQRHVRGELPGERHGPLWCVPPHPRASVSLSRKARLMILFADAGDECLVCNDHFPGSSTCDAAGPTSWCVALFSLSLPPPQSTDDRPRLQCSRRQRRDAVPEQRALVSSSSSSSSGFLGRTRSRPHLFLQRDGRQMFEWDVRQRRCVLPLLVLGREVTDSSLSQEPARARPARRSATSSRRATGRAPSPASATASCTSAAASTSAWSALFETVRARSPLLFRRPTFSC